MYCWEILCFLFHLAIVLLFFMHIFFAASSFPLEDIFSTIFFKISKPHVLQHIHNGAHTQAFVIFRPIDFSWAQNPSRYFITILYVMMEVQFKMKEIHLYQPKTANIKRTPRNPYRFIITWKYIFKTMHLLKQLIYIFQLFPVKSMNEIIFFNLDISISIILGYSLYLLRIWKIKFLKLFGAQQFFFYWILKMV